MMMLELFAKDSSVVCLQEVHGTKCEIRGSLSMWLKDWDVHISAGVKRRSAGCVIMVRKDIFANGVTVTLKVHYPGRVIELNVTHGEMMLAIRNVHNFDIPQSTVGKIADAVSRQNSDAQSKPLERAVFVASDWNFRAQGESSKSLLAPLRAEGVAEGDCTNHPMNLRWGKLLVPWSSLSSPTALISGRVQ